MKTIIKYSYILLCAAMLLSSCTETLKESISDVILTKEHHGMNGGNGTNSWEDLKSIPAEGREISVRVLAEPATSWTIQGLPNWLTATPSSGKGDTEVVFHADKNTDVDVARNATIDLVSTVAEWLVKKSYMVTQAGDAKKISISPNDDASYVFGSNGGNREIQISSNTAWKIKCQSDFCQLDKSSGTGNGIVRLTVSKYNTLDITNRYAYIEVTDGNNATVKTITVTQSPVSTTVNTQRRDVEIAYDGGSQRLSDLGGVEGGYSVSSSAPSWLSVVQVSNSGNIVVEVSANANNSGSERSAFAYVYLNAEPSKALWEIKVTQSSSNLTVGSTSENFPADGGTKSISVSSSGDWNASKDAGWLSLTKTGSGIDISAESNESLDSRSATVTVTNGIQTKTIDIRQDARTLTASDQTFSFDASGGTQTYSFTTDAQWTMTKSASWITLSKTSGRGSSEVSVKVDPTSSTSSRTGYVYFECFGKKYTITVIQSEKSVFSVSPTSLSFDTESSSRTLTVSSNGAWAVKSVSDWARMSKYSGNGNTTVTVTADVYTGTTSRTGSIVFTGPDEKEYSVSLSQESSYLNISDPLTFGSTPETQNLTVSTYGNWTASSSVSWLTVSPSSGSGNATIKLTASDNKSANSRTGYVTVKKTSNSAAKTIAVAQRGRSLSISAESLSYIASGETQTVIVTTDATSSDIVATSSSTSWLTVTRSGNLLSIKATANSATSSRTGTITVSLNGVSGLSKTINVTQTGTSYSLTADPSIVNFSSASDIQSISVQSNESWTVTKTSGADWLSLSRTTGNGNLPFTISVTSNTGSQRQATVTVTGKTSGKTATISVTQFGVSYNLSASPTSVSFGSGQSSQTITVTSNDSWTVSKSASWITLSKTSGSNNSSFSITASANTGSQRTGTVTVKGTNSGKSVTINVTQAKSSDISRDDFSGDKSLD